MLSTGGAFAAVFAVCAIVTAVFSYDAFSVARRRIFRSGWFDLYCFSSGAVGVVLLGLLTQVGGQLEVEVYSGDVSVPAFSRLFYVFVIGSLMIPLVRVNRRRGSHAPSDAELPARNGEQRLGTFHLGDLFRPVFRVYGPISDFFQTQVSRDVTSWCRRTIQEAIEVVSVEHLESELRTWLAASAVASQSTIDEILDDLEQRSKAQSEARYKYWLLSTILPLAGLPYVEAMCRVATATLDKHGASKS